MIHLDGILLAYRATVSLYHQHNNPVMLAFLWTLQTGAKERRTATDAKRDLEALQAQNETLESQLSALREKEAELRARLAQCLREASFLSKTKELRECNLNEGSLTAHKVKLWYLRKHNTPLMPIVDIIIESCLTKSSLAISGYTCLRKNLNRGTIGQPQYLWVRRATDADQARTEQLIEIQATIGKERVQDDPMYLAPDQVRGIANGPRGQRDHGQVRCRGCLRDRRIRRQALHLWRFRVDRQDRAVETVPLEKIHRPSADALGIA